MLVAECVSRPVDEHVVFRILSENGVLEAFEAAYRLERRLKKAREATARYRRRQAEEKR